MTKVKRLDVISVANISGILYAIMGLFGGLMLAFVSMFDAAFAGEYDPLGFGLGFFSILILPIVYGAIGWVSGVITAALYNLLARWTGGIKVELEQ